MSTDRSNVEGRHPNTEPEGTASPGASRAVREHPSGASNGTAPTPTVADDMVPPPSPADAMVAVASDVPVADDGSAFVTKLVGAMQAIVGLERGRIADYTEKRRRSHLDLIRERDAAGVERLRTVAADETKAIETWVEAETKRIQRESERRQKRVKDALHTSLATHRSTFDGAIEGVETAIATYRAEVDELFSRLDGVNDPVVIAEQVVKRPIFPTLHQVPEPVEARATAAVAPDSSSSATEPVEASPTSTLEEPARAGASADVDPAGAVRERETIGASAGGPSAASAVLLHTVPAVRPMSSGSQLDPDANGLEPFPSMGTGGDSCPDCSSSRTRGAFFCFSCGRELAKPAAAS